MVLFIMIAALLISSTSVLVVSLSGAMDSLMQAAKTPHFMQMHAGALDFSRLEDFVQNDDNIEAYQVVEFLNIGNEKISLGSNRLTDNVQDNGVTIQNKLFDFLLDANNSVPSVSSGQIFVPSTYMRRYHLQVGDLVHIDEMTFSIAGFLRDSQMNSSLSSSKRFLVSETDYAKLESLGTVEYLIEFRLHDISQLGNFEQHYHEAGLEANGPTITYPLFRMINALSDGLMIAVIVLISILVILIAFLCIRFTLLTKMEEEYQEIGMMKAIGLRISDIRLVYSIFYSVITGFGCLLGYCAALALRPFFLENIRIYMGEGQNNALLELVAVLSVLIVFLIIMAYVYRVLSHIKKISAADAIRYGFTQDQCRNIRFFRLRTLRFLHDNVYLGLYDVLSKKGVYASMLFVVVLAVFIIILPLNVYSTVSSDSFISYMGVGQCDLRLDIQQTDEIGKKTAYIANILGQDTDIERYSVLTTHGYQVKQDDGTKKRLKIELGDHTVFPLLYSEGKIPQAANEIALSVMQAKELGKRIGDHLLVLVGERELDLVVCGLYSDVTNGGKTAKAAFIDESKEVMWSVVNVSLFEKSLLEKKKTAFQQRFSYAKVSDIQDYLLQTYGTTLFALRKARFVAFGISLVITALISYLCMKMLLAKDGNAIALMKIVGYSSLDIRVQYLTRSVSIAIIGILLGTCIANTLGQGLMKQLIARYGVSSFHFVVDPLQSYVAAPLILVLVLVATTLFATCNAGKVDIAEHIRG